MARYIDANKLSRDVISSWDRDTHKTIEASRIHRQEHHHLMSIIEKQPTADVVEVKRGKWEKRTFIVFDNEIKDSYHCSECNTTWDTATNYCPNCGANMRGDK